jgi:hypothetical protein
MCTRLIYTVVGEHLWPSYANAAQIRVRSPVGRQQRPRRDPQGRTVFRLPHVSTTVALEMELIWLIYLPVYIERDSTCKLITGTYSRDRVRTLRLPWAGNCKLRNVYIYI